MILPTMTQAEIIKEIFKDLEFVMRKAFHLSKKLRRELIKNRKFATGDLFEYTSPLKNNWLILLILHKKTKDELPFCMPTVLFLNKQGFHGASVKDDLSIDIYSPHYIDRYKERYLRKDTLSKTEALKAYLSTNVKHNLDLVKDEKRHGKCFFARIPDGIGLGYQERIEGKTVNHFKTFIRSDMIKDFQEKVYDDTTDEVFSLIDAIRIMQAEDI